MRRCLRAEAAFRQGSTQSASVLALAYSKELDAKVAIDWCKEVQAARVDHPFKDWHFLYPLETLHYICGDTQLLQFIILRWDHPTHAE